MRKLKTPQPASKKSTQTLLFTKKEKEYIQAGEDTQKRKYDIEFHYRNFNMWEHGYIWKRGCMWYRRPDGVDVRAYSAVNEMDEYGELIPR